MNAVGEGPTPSPGEPSPADVPAEPSDSGSRSAGMTPSVSAPSQTPAPQWTFLTNHAHVLILLSRNPSVVLREVALQIGITERAVQRIIADLEASGIIEREKVGRQNRYRIRTDRPLRHPVEARRKIGELLALVNRAEG